MITSTDRDALIDGRYDRGRLEIACLHARRLLPADLTPAKKRKADTDLDVAFMDAMLGEYLVHVEEQGDEDEIEKAQLLVRMSQDYLSGVDADFLYVDTRYRKLLEARPARQSTIEFVNSIPNTYPKMLRKESDEQLAAAREVSGKEFTESAERYHDLPLFIYSLHEHGRLTTAYTKTLLVMLGFETVNGQGSLEGYYKLRSDFRMYFHKQREGGVPDGISESEQIILDEGLQYLELVVGSSMRDRQQGFSFETLVGYSLRRFDNLTHTRKHVAARLGYALDVLIG